MPLIGDYIYLRAENYEKSAGIVQSKRAQAVTEKLFNGHRNHILALAEKFKVDNLSDLERQYNKNNTEQYQQLVKLLTSAKNSRDIILRELVTRMSPKENPWTDKMIQDIMNGFKLDLDHQTITCEIPASAKNQQIYIKEIGVASQYRYIDSFMQRAKKLYQEISVHPNLTQDTKIRYNKKINEWMQTLAELDKTQEQNYDIVKAIEKDLHYSGTIPVKVGNKMYEEMSNIRFEINGVESLVSNLQWKFSELMGNMAADTGYLVGQDIIINHLKQYASKGLSQTTKNIKGVGITQRLVIDELDKNKTTLVENGTFQDSVGKLRTNYLFSGMGDARNQKADVEFNFDVNGVKEKIGISLKNTDLSSHLNKQIDDLTKGFISLQNSSLLLYLAGMEQTYPNIANHYLNVFVEHEDGVVSSNLLQAAQKSLATAILFSALTGASQLREGGQARVLAVYDKTEKNHIKQVKFFDVYSLVQDADKNTQFSPALHPESLKIANAKEESQTALKDNINVRITKTLLNAKNKTIATYISKNYLATSHKSRFK